MSVSSPASSTVKLRGGCDCGAITYTSTSLPQEINNCYCRTCRKTSGSPFISYAGLATSSLTWTFKHPDALRLRSSDIADRAYCGTCLSHLYMVYFLAPGKTHVTLGSVDEESVGGVIARPAAHLFVEQKVEWFEIAQDHVPRFDRFPDGFQERIDEFLG